MLLLEGNMDGLGVLVVGSLLFWIINIIVLITGLVRLKKNPESAKKLLIGSGVMLLVGAGVCGLILGVF